MTEIKITYCKPSRRYERVNTQRTRSKLTIHIKHSDYVRQMERLDNYLALIDERRKSEWK